MAANSKRIDARFLGPIIDTRYVQLKDGRRVQQITRDGYTWITPATIDVMTLSEDEKCELIDALRPHPQDPSQR